MASSCPPMTQIAEKVGGHNYKCQKPCCRIIKFQTQQVSQHLR